MTFLPIPHYQGLYSFDTTTWQVWSERKKQFLKFHKHRGYKAVYIYLPGSKAKHKKTHQIVAELFLPIIPGKTQLNHIDGNKWNDALNNLERCTAQENVLHARDVLKKQFGQVAGYIRGPMPESTKQKLRGPRNPHGAWSLDDPRRTAIRKSFSKEVSCYNQQGILVNTYPSVTEASYKIGKAISSICNCLSGRKKTSGGFIWKYTETK